MKISAFILGCICLFAAAAGVPAQDSVQELEFPPANAEITKQALRHHLSYLASDEMRGRKAGSPESVRVSEYLGAALEQVGVQSLESLEGMFQPVPLVRQEFDATPELVLTDSEGREVQAAGHH